MRNCTDEGSSACWRLTLPLSAALFLPGELYPTPLGTAMLSQLLSYTFMVGLFLMMVGEWFFTSVVNSEPARKFVRLLKDNQLPTMLVLMACNMASTRLLANGAFEVYFNDELVFSKLDTGLVPDGNYLMERFKNFQVADTIGDY